MPLKRLYKSGRDLLSRDATVQVSSTLRSLTAVFGMGTGVTFSSYPPESYCVRLHTQNHIMHIQFQEDTIILLTIYLHTCFFWSSPRPISTSQLNALLHLHSWPIYHVVYMGSYLLLVGYLILRWVSRLDAFSVYPCRTWLPSCATGVTTGAP